MPSFCMCKSPYPLTSTGNVLLLLSLLFCGTSNSFLRHSHPLFKATAATIPKELIYFQIPMRMKRAAKINSQRRGILLLTLDGSPCIQAQAEALNTPKRLLGSTQQAWSSACQHSSCHFKCSPTAPVRHRPSSLSWTANFMKFRWDAFWKPYFW